MTEKELNKLISNRLNLLLKQKVLNTAELANLTGTSHPTATKWRSGLHDFKISDIAMIEKAIGEKLIEITVIETKTITVTRKETLSFSV
jgi:transcriptional regulator with XRE-family HTH domain